MDKLPGKSDGECASPAGLACCSDVSAVRTGDRQGKAQPQSESRRDNAEILEQLAKLG